MVTRTVNIRVVTSNSAALGRIDKGVQNIDRSATAATASLFTLSKVASAVVSVLALRRLAQYSDSWVGLQNRLRQVTTSSEDLAQVTDRLFQIAQASRVGLEQVGTLYFRLSQAAKRLGIDQEQAAAITESLSNSLTASGLTAGEVNSVLLQTSQAFNKGFLNGDEFRTISEALPVVLDLVAKELRITRSEVNKFAEEGRITGQVIANALIKNLDNSRQVIRDSTITIDQSLTILGNSVTRFIGEFGQITGISESVAKAFVNLGQNFDTLLALINTGSLQEVFRTQFLGINQDINEFIRAIRVTLDGFLQDQNVNTDLAGQAISENLTQFGPNLRFAIQEAVVRFAGFLDKVKAFGIAVKRTLDFTDEFTVQQARNRFEDAKDRIDANVEAVVAGLEKGRDKDIEVTALALQNADAQIAKFSELREAKLKAFAPGGSDNIPTVDTNTLTTAQRNDVLAFEEDTEELIILALDRTRRLREVSANSFEVREAEEDARRVLRITKLEEEFNQRTATLTEAQAKELGLLQLFEDAKESIVVESEQRIANLRERFQRQQVSQILGAFGQLSQLNRKSQGLQRISIVANTADAVIKSYNNAGGYPFGIIPAAIMAAIGAQQLRAVGKNSVASSSSGGGSAPSSPGLNLSSLTNQSIIPTTESNFRTEVLNELRNRDPDEPLSVDFTRRIVTAINSNSSSGVIDNLGGG